MSSGFIHVVTGVRIPFLADTEEYRTVQVDPIFFSCSSDDGHLGYFCLLAAGNDAAVNVRAQASLQTLLSVLLDIHPEVEFQGPMVVPVVGFSEDPSHRFPQQLHQPHQPAILPAVHRVPVSPHPRQGLSFSGLFRE